jgi:hypothetical protein
MRRPFRFFVFLAWLVAIIAAGLAWQHRATSALRAELAERERAAREEKRVSDEQAALHARQVSPEELAARQEEHEAWVALTGEIATQRNRLGAKKPVAASKPPRAVGSTLKDGPVSAAEWRDAGQETPAAAFETALWAAAGGDVTKLASVLELDEETRQTAAGIFNGLPPGLQREVGTSDQLVALLTARAVPLGQAWILGQFDEQPGESSVLARLTDAEGNKRELMLLLRGHEGSWRLVVPPQAMAKYTSFLQGKKPDRP